MNGTNQGLSQGILMAAQGLSEGFKQRAQKQEQNKMFTAQSKATESLLKAYLPKEQVAEVLAVNPDETPAARHARLTGTIENFVVENKLKQFAAAQQQAQTDQQALAAAMNQFLPQNGQPAPFNPQRFLGTYFQSGGSPQSLDKVDQALKMFAPAGGKTTMVFPNMESLEAKFPAAQFDYSMVQTPEGTIEVDKVSPRAPQTSIEPGFEPDPQRPGAVRPIKGGSADIKRQESEAASKERMNQEVIRADVILNAINQVMPRVDALTAGMGGAVLGAIPGTEAKDVSSVIDTIKANIGFEQLQNMRKASPTGGALGQIAVKELEFLQAALGNLSTNQSPKQLTKTLGEVKNHYERWKASVQGINPDEITDGVDLNLLQYMTPEQRALFKK